MHNLVVFASGRGSNAQAIHAYFNENRLARIALVITNKTDAGIIPWAEQEGIPVQVAGKAAMEDPSFLLKIQETDPSLLLLAGFLRKVPDAVVQAYENRILNIHPALLPRHGGKGMWGHHVHEAVLAASEKESGITVHLVNEHYDEGAVLLQARCPVLPADTPDDLAARVLKLEHYYYPRAVEFTLKNSGFRISDSGLV